MNSKMEMIVVVTYCIFFVLSSSYAETEISGKFEDVDTGIQDPIVSIIVKEAKSQIVYVTGEVEQPGKYSLRSDITIVQAITLAGGFIRWADTDKIVVIRKSHMVPEGNRFTIKYSDVVSGKNMKANILLKAGDTIIVP